MTLLTYDLADDLQLAVRMMDDGCRVLSIWDDRLRERRCTIEWGEVERLVRLIEGDRRSEE